MWGSARLLRRLAAAAATAWPRPRSCESNARPFRVGAGVTAVAASRPKMNETVAAAAKMLLALLDLDCLAFMRGATSSVDAGIVLRVTGIVSGRRKYECRGICVVFMMCFFADAWASAFSYEKNARGTYLHT